MWLLNGLTYELEYFIGKDIPPYVILSHRWGLVNDEVTFQELMNDQTAQRDAWETVNADIDGNVESYRYQPSRRITRKIGWRKIEMCCAQARYELTAEKKSVKYAWVDTCCIDKNSSAELSEAINSMYTWYKKAHICYAFLEDVPNIKTMETSDWWFRGWTLQELLAPTDVIFYDNSWLEIGRRSRDVAKISLITGIDMGAVSGVNLDIYTVATKMAWAAARQITREEDRTYSLLGMFGVNMPLLYGEGSKAFRRLQEELLKKTDDLSIFAWAASNLTVTGMFWITPTLSIRGDFGVLAPSVDFFLDCRDLTLHAGIQELERVLQYKTDFRPNHAYPDLQQISCAEGVMISNLGISSTMLLLQYSQHEFFMPVGYESRDISRRVKGIMLRWDQYNGMLTRIIDSSIPHCKGLAWLSLPVNLEVRETGSAAYLAID